MIVKVRKHYISTLIMTILILSGVKAGMEVNKEWIPVSLLSKTVSKLTDTLPDQVIPNILAFLNMEKSTTPELGQYQVFINPVSGNKKVHFPITVHFYPGSDATTIRVSFQPRSDLTMLHEDIARNNKIFKNSLYTQAFTFTPSEGTCFEKICNIILHYLFYGTFKEDYEIKELIRNYFQQVSDQDKYIYPSCNQPVRHLSFDTSHFFVRHFRHDCHYSIFRPRISGRYAKVLYRINLIDPQDPRRFMDTESAKIKSKEIIDSPEISVRKLICVMERMKVKHVGE